jgi:SAM-dependent methyltransferase
VTTYSEPYPLDNDHDFAEEHHDGLAELLDPVTVQRLRELRVDWSGAACLEVGAGAGSIARYLAGAVGPTGRVVALDLKPQHIAPHPQLSVVQHDLSGADPLPEGPWDLIHARLVLSHLPAREEILRRLAGVLAPGGVILIEDWNALSTDVVMAAPDRAAAEVYAKYQRVVGLHVFAAAGTDRTWSRRTNLAMRRLGLTGVETRVDASYWAGGGAGCRLVKTMTYEVTDALLANGFDEDEIALLRVVLDDPRLLIHGHPLYSTSGWRPVAASGEPDWSAVYTP